MNATATTMLDSTYACHIWGKFIVTIVAILWGMCSIYHSHCRHRPHIDICLSLRSRAHHFHSNIILLLCLSHLHVAILLHHCCHLYLSHREASWYLCPSHHGLSFTSALGLHFYPYNWPLIGPILGHIAGLFWMDWLL